MNEVFRRADRVLVLDPDIERGSLRDSTWIELYARVVMSPWQRRLWTLVEGALAGPGNLYVKCRDGVFSPGNVENLVEDPPIPSELVSSMVRLRQGIDFMSSPDSPDRMKWIAGELEYRATGKDEDESVCIAILMHQDPFSILQGSDAAERMKRLYHQLSPIPRWLLFSAGQRIAEKGYRWAPRSFLPKHRLSRPLPQNQGGSAEIGPNGVLQFRSAGYILSPSRIPLKMLLFNSHDRFCILRVFSSFNTERITVMQRRSRAKKSAFRWIRDERERPVLYDNEPLAIIIDKYPTPLGPSLVGILVALGDFSQERSMINLEARMSRLMVHTGRSDRGGSKSFTKV